MGMMTAYYASLISKKVCLVEKSTLNNKKSSSYGISRSYRNDYTDSYYANLAFDSNRLWKEIELETNSKLLINCGVLNIAKKSITTNLQDTYANKSYQTIKKLNIPTKKYSRSELAKNFPQFDADLATLDVDAGLIDVNESFKVLRKQIKARGVEIFENCQIRNIYKAKNYTLRLSNNKRVTTENIVVTAGVWTNLILKDLINYPVFKIPVVPVKQVVKYFQVPKRLMQKFSSNEMPVFAYLDVGIYGHPIYGNAPGIKIAYFDPNGAKFSKTGLKVTEQYTIKNQESFIKTCLKGIDEPKMIKKAFGYYQMTPDNNFLIGKLPGYQNIFVATGFCGTGFKFAPLVGKILSDLALRKSTIYNIDKFSLKRFSGINTNSLSIAPKMLKYLNPNNWSYLKLGLSRLTYNKIK